MKGLPGVPADGEFKAKGPTRRKTPAELRKSLTEMRMEMNSMVDLVEGMRASLLWMAHQVRVIYAACPQIVETDEGLELVRSSKALLERAGVADTKGIFANIEMPELVELPEAKRSKA